MRKPIAYLDYNATAPVHSEVITAVSAALGVTGNPSSIHASGRKARALVEQARETVAQTLGCSPRDLVFTSGGTEANAQVLLGAPVERFLISAIEHDSVRANAPQAQVIPVQRDGRVDLGSLEQQLALTGGATLVSIMHANNETGVIQPLADISALVRSAGAFLHVDAVQSFGKLPMAEVVAYADLVTLSAHKIGGPKGVGALAILNPKAEPRPLSRGGGQEMARRAGTENIGGIAGFGAACTALAARGGWMGTLELLRNQMETKLIAHGAVVAGYEAPRLGNTSTLAMPGVDASRQLMAFDLEGVAVSAGAACSSGKVKSSHVLEAMGWTPLAASQAIRVSLGWDTQPEEVDRFVAAWANLAQRLGIRQVAAE